MQRSGLSWVEQLGDNATSRLQVSLDDFNLLPGMSRGCLRGVRRLCGLLVLSAALLRFVIE